jgi:hypothetical protein
LYMLCLKKILYNFFNNLYILYTQNSTSLIVKMLTLYKCWEILL